MNAVRLAVGTLTVLPVRAPRVDRRTAGRAMVLAPLVGLGLGLVGCLPLLLLTGTPLLAAALAVGTLALLTRGLHLDGLADTADGLGSGRRGPEALAVMRKGDVGPFGVATLVLVLLVQVAALGHLTAAGAGAPGLVAAAVVSRLALPLACLRGVRPARAEGLGAAVAGSVSRPSSGIALVLAAVPLTALGVATDGTVGWAVLGLVAGAALGRRAVRRLGGITGDVLGAVVEATFTASLVALAAA